MKYVSHFTLALPVVCVQCPIWLFFVVPWFRACIVCCPDIVWVILKWFQSPLLLQVSLLLSHSTCAEFLQCSLYILDIFSASFLITFLSPRIATSINMHVPFFIIMDYDVRFIVRNNSVCSHLLVFFYIRDYFRLCPVLSSSHSRSMGFEPHICWGELHQGILKWVYKAREHGKLTLGVISLFFGLVDFITEEFPYDGKKMSIMTTSWTWANRRGVTLSVVTLRLSMLEKTPVADKASGLTKILFRCHCCLI